MHYFKNNIRKILAVIAGIIGVPLMFGADVVPQKNEMIYARTFNCEEARASHARNPVFELDIPEGCTGDHATALFSVDGEKKEIEIPLEKYAAMGQKDGVTQNPTVTEYKSILDLVTPKADAAIAFDATTDVQSSGSCSSQTFALDPVSTSDNVIIVGAYNSEYTATGVTYNSNALTVIDQYAIQGAEYLSLWYRVAVGNSSANVVVSYGGTSGCRAQATSYTGVKQTDTIAQNGSSTLLPSHGTPTYHRLTVSGADSASWIVSVQRNNISNLAAGPNLTLRGTAGSTQMGDSNTTATSTWIYQLTHNAYVPNDGYATSLWAEICESSGCAGGGGGSTPSFSTEFIIFE